MKYYFRNTILLCFVLLPTLLFSTFNIETTSHTSNIKKKDLAIYYTFKGNIEKEYNTFVEKKLKSIGFNLTDPHKRVNDQYEVKYGSTILEVLSFMPIVKDSAILPLLNIDPRIAGFAPFNLVIHKKLDENVTYVGHLLPEVMLDILGIKNKEVRGKFTATFKTLDATIAQELGGHIATIPYKKLPEKRMINFEYQFDTPEDIDEFIDEFQNTFELAFIDKGYLIAGYHNFMEATNDAEKILSEYDAFWTYSLCHLKFSYHMFDNLGGRPEAGLFAPCTMYMYIRKGSNKVVIGMYRLHNWSDALNITDKTRLDLIDKLDTEIPKILTSLGMKSVPNVNPLLSNNNTPKRELQSNRSSKTVKNKIESPKEIEKSVVKKEYSPTLKSESVQDIKVAGSTIKITIPSVPKVPKCASSYNADIDRSIKFSKRVPPGYVPHSFDKSQKSKSSSNTAIGQVNNGKISAYLRGDFMPVEKAQEILKDAGFKIIATTPLNKAKDLISIVFTDKLLQTMSSKENRGFMSTLRLLVDNKDKRISITNPIYMAKGFLQNDFDEKSANRLLIRLVQAFEGLTNSKDALKFQLLSKYQFMNGMPKYENMVEVASGANLLEKLKDNDKVIFSQKLESGSTLIGIRLGKRTRKFIKRIGRNNAAMLPYPILIENGKAKILDPKYYISFMYPLLTMSEFMTIATVPDAMIKDCMRVFK
jgi:uncharacterized protein (DUF302 family)